MSQTITKKALIGIASASASASGIGALLVIAALAVPLQSWRTGQVTQPQLRHSPAPHHAVKPARGWIYADVACGTGKRRGLDDGLALRSLANAAHIDVAGMSTVFGHAPVFEADSVMRAPLQEMGSCAGRPVAAALPVFRGCGAASQKCLQNGGSLDVQAALRRASQRGTLNVVALGPRGLGARAGPGGRVVPVA